MSNENVNLLNDMKNNTKHRKNELLKLKKDIDPYLEKINIKSIRDVFDSFLEWNSSDDEDFYEDSSTLSTINSKKKKFSKYPARHLYSTYDDFLSGYENDKYLKRFKALVADEKKQIEKIYVKDLLKIDINMKNFDKIQKNKFYFNKKLTSYNNIYAINKEKIFNFKSCENKNNEDVFKIMNISSDYNFNYKYLSPYIINIKSFKNEDASKPILIHFGKNQSDMFKTVNINDDEKGKKSLYGKLNIEDLFKRAKCLSYDRYNDINKPVTVIIKFLKMLKIKYEKNKEMQKNKSQKIFSKKNQKLNYNHYSYRKNNISAKKNYNNEKEKSEQSYKEDNSRRKSKGIYFDKNQGKDTKSKASSDSPRKKFYKINNEIYTLNELKNYFREEKEKDEEIEDNKNRYNLNEFNKKEALMAKIKNKIDGYMSNQKNQYHEQLKKKVEKLLYVQEGSFNNGDNKSINEMYNMLNLSNSDILFNEADDDDDENTVSNEERKNIKLLQNNTDEDLAEPIPDIMPTYQTQFINGFINKIQKSKKK